MNSSYRIVQTLESPTGHAGFNMHDLVLIDGGRRALYLLTRSEDVDVSDLHLRRRRGYILNSGFRELDLATGKVLFEWWAYPAVRLNESNVTIENLNGPYAGGYDWF